MQGVCDIADSPAAESERFGSFLVVDWEFYRHVQLGRRNVKEIVGKPRAFGKEVC